MARRVSLREFQQDLVRRLNEAAAADAPSARLGVQVGSEVWLVRLEEASEVIPVPAIANVPLTQGWFRGLANIRGNLFSVIDLSAFQGGEPTPQTPDSRLLLVAERYRRMPGAVRSAVAPTVRALPVAVRGRGLRTVRWAQR